MFTSVQTLSQPAALLLPRVCETALWLPPHRPTPRPESGGSPLPPAARSVLLPVLSGSCPNPLPAGCPPSPPLSLSECWGSPAGGCCPLPPSAHSGKHQAGDEGTVWPHNRQGVYWQGYRYYYRSKSCIWPHIDRWLKCHHTESHAHMSWKAFKWCCLMPEISICPSLRYSFVHISCWVLK